MGNVARFKRIYIEITSSCNLKCSFCQETLRSPHFMSVDEFAHTLQQIRPYTNYIYLHVKGEPLLHPQLDEILALCRKAGVTVNLTTNGTLLADKLPILLAHPPHQMNVSLHSADDNDCIDMDTYIAQLFASCETLLAQTDTEISLRLWNTTGVLDQEVTIYADNYTPVNDILIPTGEIKSVENTALDFRKGKKIRDGLGAFDKDEKTVTEYDHNFVLNGDEICDVAKAAQFICEDTGRMLEVYTDQPGMQLYTAGTLTVENAKDGMSYGNFSGACFETQNFPNAINTEGFPNAVLKAGEEYSTTTVFRFSVND